MIRPTELHEERAERAQELVVRRARVEMRLGRHGAAWGCDEGGCGL